MQLMLIKNIILMYEEIIKNEEIDLIQMTKARLI